MNILEALESGKIRYDRGERFDAQSKFGQITGPWIQSLAGLEEHVLRPNREKYVGAEFARFDEELPANVPLNNYEHTWASVVLVGESYEVVGVVVIWSSDEREAAHRVSQPQPLSFDEFNVRRHGEVE